VLQHREAICDAGSLILVYAIARQLGSKARAVRTAALVGGSFILAYAMSSWYEPAPLFFLLLATYLALRDRFAASAFAASLGILTKLVPIVIVPMVLRRIMQLRNAVRYLATLAVTIGGRDAAVRARAR